MRGWAAGLDWRGASGRQTFLGVLALWIVLFGGTVLAPPFSALALLVWPLTGVVLFLVFGVARRRLRAIGASGWWLWLLAVPFVSLFFAIFLAVRRGNPDASPGGVNRLAQFGVALLCLLVASRALWEPYTSPAGSMKPTLHVGDYFVVTPSRGTPARGDVVVFVHPVRDTTFVKRVMALPGETIEIRGGLPVIDGAPLKQTTDGVFTELFGPAPPYPRCANDPVPGGGICEKPRYVETTPEGRSHRVLDIHRGPLDTRPGVLVPEGHVFVMGDNRDNSLDSRTPRAAGGVGMVPVGNIVGRARRVIFNAEALPGRFFRRIE